MRTTLAGVLTSMPGIGVRTAARILLEIGDATNFKSSGHTTPLICLAQRQLRGGDWRW